MLQKNIVDITNEYNIHILFSTKSDNVYNVNLNPELHSFQLSVTNLDNRKDLEPNVPDIESRFKFFCDLKEKGFRVGIRVQPFIPGISDLRIFEKFKDADHFTIEGLKIIANNLELRKELLELTGLQDKDFKNMGLLNLRPEVRLKHYLPIIQWCKENNKSYSIADNDLHFLGNNRCCCGDILTFGKYTKFNTTYMSHIPEPRTDYSLEEVLNNIEKENILNSNCKHYFFSIIQGDCVTVKDFYEKKFSAKTSTFSPKFFYTNQEALDLIDTNLIEEKEDFQVEHSNTREDVNDNPTLEKDNFIHTVSFKDLKNKNYYGWKCPVCESIYSPAIPFCSFCSSTDLQKYFIPYWNISKD